MLLRSSFETEAFAFDLALRMPAGTQAVALFGGMGAGKTTFARGFFKGLGFCGFVTSPTYTIVNEYTPKLFHFDWYRLSGADELEAAGLTEYIGGDAVALIEWPEKCWDALPACHLRISMAYGTGENEREITMIPSGGFREEF